MIIVIGTTSKMQGAVDDLIKWSQLNRLNINSKKTTTRITGRPLSWTTYSFVISSTTPHHNCFTAHFLGPPRWAGTRRELLDFMVQGKINRGRHSDHPAGRHSIRTNQCPPPWFPHVFLRFFVISSSGVNIQVQDSWCIGRLCFEVGWLHRRNYIKSWKEIVVHKTVEKSRCLRRWPVVLLRWWRGVTVTSLGVSTKLLYVGPG